MKSLCFKTNNENMINFIIRNLTDFDDIVVSSNEFKIYKNVIIHYIGDDMQHFLFQISKIISKLIELFYERKILDKIIEINYFYFEDYEKEIILKISEKIIEIQEANLEYKNEILKGLIYEYFLDNKIMILDGFVNFRIKPYLDVLDFVVDTSVTNYVISLQWKIPEKIVKMVDF